MENEELRDQQWERMRTIVDHTYCEDDEMFDYIIEWHLGRLSDSDFLNFMKWKLDDTETQLRDEDEIFPEEVA